MASAAASAPYRAAYPEDAGRYEASLQKFIDDEGKNGQGDELERAISLAKALTEPETTESSVWKEWHNGLLVIAQCETEEPSTLSKWAFWSHFEHWWLNQPFEWYRRGGTGSPPHDRIPKMHQTAVSNDLGGSFVLVQLNDFKSTDQEAAEATAKAHQKEERTPAVSDTHSGGLVSISIQSKDLEEQPQPPATFFSPSTASGGTSILVTVSNNSGPGTLGESSALKEDRKRRGSSVGSETGAPFYTKPSTMQSDVPSV